MRTATIDTRTYGRRLEDARLQVGPWTQRELARRAGIHYNTVCRVEKEDTWPSLIVQQKLSTALGMPRAELFT
jgi:DNA-binding XRE family transcriptional regulator